MRSQCDYVKRGTSSYVSGGNVIWGDVQDAPRFGYSLSCVAPEDRTRFYMGVIFLQKHGMWLELPVCHLWVRDTWWSLCVDAVHALATVVKVRKA